MSSEQQSCLRFSVEESVWFQKGQEVAELISIALDPDIQIYDQDQYVSIRGALLLSGEYHPFMNEEEEEDYRPFTQARVVQEVEVREDGVCALQHRFPVDITIPKNRIQSLDEIYVSIESFDYSVPARGCLQLDAELSISGIYGHQQSAPVMEEFLQEEEDGQDAFEAEEEREYEPMYRSARSEYDAENDDFQYVSEDDDDEEEILNQDEVDANTQYNYNDAGEYEPFEVEARKSAVEEEVDYDASTSHYQADKVYTEDPFSPIYAFQSSNQEEEEEEEAAQNLASFFEKRQQQEKVVEQAYHDGSAESRDENALSLTKIFADEDGEEFTRLKICIVQQGESIDHIAERYDVTIQQLIRINRLSTEDNVNEGQLLYIPVKATSKS
ncbi:stage VI sporulation protein D [Bacillus tianshenii]|uniref:Stage VI sporulation protein D n=1 Tax=Sutcliffiella tianshenii TaxID=1463404 RepID=A0ABS2P0L5_9BACI|nr:stage VI sporulation protein D [Bacillus tianshenii]MBM7620478.1 stage VI sporulation protein D [Bacillus tianshenii]